MGWFSRGAGLPLKPDSVNSVICPHVTCSLWERGWGTGEWWVVWYVREGWGGSLVSGVLTCEAAF